MNLIEVLSIELRLSEIESELDSDISESAKDSLYAECCRLENRLEKIFGDKEEIYSMGDDD